MKLIDRMLREYIPTVMRGDVSVPTNPTTDNVVCQLRINSPLNLHPNAPVSFYFPSLHSSASPPSRHPRPPLFKKKDQKKNHSQILIPPFCFQSSTRLSLLSHSPYYRLLRFNSPRTPVSDLSHHILTTVPRLCHGR